MHSREPLSLPGVFQGDDGRAGQVRAELGRWEEAGERGWIQRCRSERIKVPQGGPQKCMSHWLGMVVWGVRVKGEGRNCKMIPPNPSSPLLLPCAIPNRNPRLKTPGSVRGQGLRRKELSWPCGFYGDRCGFRWLEW